MIKLTNASEGYKDNIIYINPDWIVAMFEQPTDGGSLTTVIYGGPVGTSWIVEESLGQIYNLIKVSK